MTYENHLADLRNKYGQIYFYFQMKARERAGDMYAKKVLIDLETKIVGINEDFVALLKTDPGLEAEVAEAPGS